MASLLCFKAVLGFILILACSLLASSTSVAEMRAKWEGIADEVGKINKQARAVKSPVADEASTELIKSPQEPEVKPIVKPNAPPLTSTLVAWVSSQSEGIVQEMEAIANQNAESSSFSVVNYLRYLKLYDSLKVIAHQPLQEFRWVSRKAKVFSKVYNAATEIVLNYLTDLDTSLSKIEAAEPKGKANEVGKDWIELYESIRYIATHAPIGSNLAKEATQMLQKSPNNTSDKMRSVRYQLKTHAFNR